MWREAPSAPPLGELLSECEAEGVRYEIMSALQNTDDTLSVSPFGLPALPEGEPRALRAEALLWQLKIPPYQLFGTEGFLLQNLKSENLHIIQQCLIRAHISAVHCLGAGEADGLQDLAQRAGNGNPGDGDELASIVVVGQPDFAADVIL